MSDPVLLLRRAHERFVTRVEGIQTRHLFSFGEHYDPVRVGHGVLMVSNEERLLAGRGFDDHPHADAEVLTWVLSGSLVHTDSRGHAGVVVPGLAQRMSAGAGIVHAERNDAYRTDPGRPAVPVHFVQMWLRPDEPGVAPSYGQGEVDRAELSRSWLPVVSGRHPDAAVSLGSAGSTLWVTVLAAGVTRELPTGPLAHLYVARGEVELEGAGRLGAGDSVQVTGEAPLALTGLVEAEVLLWTLAA
ncbi:pirin family protein [uncultured Friedmanniella sp.]|uniref:pirin family protein n=1 Tax=uncultured Friedmanniella sp. TaxID=335381 RepID=UPI0035C962DB